MRQHDSIIDPIYIKLKLTEATEACSSSDVLQGAFVTTWMTHQSALVSLEGLGSPPFPVFRKGTKNRKEINYCRTDSIPA